MSQQAKRFGRSRRSWARASGGEARSGSTRPLLLFGAAIAAPVGLRVALLAEHALVPAAGDWRGALSDLAVALAVAMVVGLFARLHRFAGAALLLLWALLCYGNYEHVLANGENASLLYAGYLSDQTFLFGSALAITHPWLWIAIVTTTLAFGWAALRSNARVRLREIAIASACAFVGTWLWTAAPEVLDWRQKNFVAQNATRPIRSVEPPVAGEPSGASERAPDFAGEPRVPFGEPNTNVLLVILEGVSGAYLAPIAEANERTPIGASMPRLGRIARDYVYYTSFIAQQRQTNRGEYAVLCGELPRLLSAEAKMSELATSARADWSKRCLPAALAEAGYATVYLQAAPMAFMLKDKFMPRIGFERSYGDEYFENAYSRNKWGVDDRTFLQQSLRMIDELRAGDRPWFLTLLTVGTHHPINVPDDYPREEGFTPKWRAFDYLDVAVEEFIASLEARGVFDDTLVIFLSDESQGLRRGLNDTQIRLSQSWGFLVAMLPGGAKARVDDPYAQSDVAGSILDWLGLGEYAHGFSGRSVFRRYATPRALVFGNTYVQRVGGVSADGELALCAEDLRLCMGAATEDQRLFKSGLEALPAASAKHLASLRDQVAESMQISGLPAEPESGVATGGARDFRLSSEPVFRIRDDVDDLQWVFGGQYLSVPANSRIDVDLEVEVVGDAGRVQLQHALKSDQTNFFGQQISDVQPGGRVHFRYSYSSAESIDRVGNYLIVTRMAGSGLSLKLPRARMQIVPNAEVSNPPLVIHQLDVELAPNPAVARDAAAP